MKPFFTPRSLLVCVLVCAVFAAGCSSWRPPSRPVVSKSGKSYTFPRKYEFREDLRVALKDSSVVELKGAYAADSTLFGTAESGSVAIPFRNITRVEEKDTPVEITPRMVVLVALLTAAVVFGIGSAAGL